MAGGLPPARLLVRTTAHKRQPALQQRADPRTTTTTAAFKPGGSGLAFKAIRRLMPDYPLWRDFPYEYEVGKLAIDVINGGPLLREWVDDPAATAQDLELLAQADEADWQRERQPHLLY
jgi:hypothetical protein